MSRSRKTRRGYKSLEAINGALKRDFDAVWSRFVQPIQPSQTIYHYCAAETLPKIVHSKGLWARDILRMNDEREIEYAFTDVLAPLVSEVRNGHPKYFLKAIAPAEQIRGIWGHGKSTHIACFSSTSQLLSQWQQYADLGRGFAIGFDRAALQKWCNDWGTAGAGVTLVPIAYCPTTQVQLVRAFLEKVDATEQARCTPETVTASRDEARTWLGILSTCLKRPEAAEEQEWRVLIIQRDDRNHFSRLIAPDGIGYFALDIVSPMFVTEVVCGPENTTTIADIKALLNAGGLGTIPVRRATTEDVVGH